MKLVGVSISLIAAAGILLAQGRGRGAAQPAVPLGKTASEDPGPGNAANGRAVFEGKGACLTCHRVSGNGALSGPDLTAVATRVTRDTLEKAVLDPDAEVQNHTYRVVTRDGAAIAGKLLNQDAFGLQLLDSAQHLRGFQKANLREYGFVPATPMPSYRGKLTADEVADVVAYMASLNGRSLGPQVSFDRIINANKEPQNWLTHGGTLQAQRYSLLDQITPANVKDLELKWAFPVRALDPFETTPLVVDGVLYTMQLDDVVALDATTGRIFWIYRHPIPTDAKHCCGNLSRGLGLLGNALFLATEDDHVIALDASTGNPLWDTTVAGADSKAGYSFDVAPLVVKDKVIVGTAGGEYGVRGFIVALDAHTGKEAWRFNTVAGPGEAGGESWGGDSWKHGGGSIWATGTYDAETNMTIWGVGNAGPDYNGDVRPGDNLYTCSMVGLDADTGKLKWYYQANPHNEFDWDAVQVPLVADIPWQGKPRKTILWANRNGFFYVLDRTNGRFLLGKPFVRQNWNVGFDEKGRPMMAPNAKASAEGNLIYPDTQGGTNWFAPSYSPRTGLFYVDAREGFSNVFAKTDEDFEEGTQYTGHGIAAGGRGGRRRPEIGGDEDKFTAVRALDPQTGERKWEFKLNTGNALSQCAGLSCAAAAGILTTASDVLFAGNRDGEFVALDARNGTLLWKTLLGGQINMNSITYAVDGKQYVAVNSGNSLFVFGLR
jgi:alcohol dehydrogenase (cytochrome c)